MILHICTKEAWEGALATGSYKGDTLATQGFIHCSTPNQVVEVANHIFKDKANLLLLVIDEGQVGQEIKYEDAGNGILYPHIYGPLPTIAVTHTVDFPTSKDGTFALPNLES